VQKLSGAVFCTRKRNGKPDNIVSNQWRIGIKPLLINSNHNAEKFNIKLKVA